MLEHQNMIKFLNQFMRTIKQEVKNVGIITDKDGTVLLDDSLKIALQNFKEKNLGVNVYLIANSGRTVQDMINSLKEENIPVSYFDYIIGDNGGMCIDINNNKQLYKHIMDNKIVLQVINKFIDLGGDLENVRLADGSNIYAYPSDAVKYYYKDRNGIVYSEDISNLDGIDITKLTLTGSHELINKINKYIREDIKGNKTHIGKTSFPNVESNNYRVDFTGMHTKGEAAQDLREKLNLDTCIFLGNDLNDISMFSNALDNDDFIVIASNEKQDITNMLVEYLQSECKIKGIEWQEAKLIVLEDNNVNEFLHRMSKILGVLNSAKKTQSQDKRPKYKANAKYSGPKTIKRKKSDGRIH